MMRTPFFISSAMIGISKCRLKRVTCFLVPRTVEKTLKTTVDPAGHRIFLTASSAVLACIVSPSTA